MFFETVKTFNIIITKPLVKWPPKIISSENIITQVKYKNKIQKYVLINGLEIEKKAVALSLAQCRDKKIKDRLGQYFNKYSKDIKEGIINWDFIQKDLIKNSLAYAQKMDI